ncbi:MAG: sodium ion-translocating decarboxylase subunit beta [Chloroflexi bacterium]|nr:sodium ion-translocating decarboxylase subunit beta [Chloroflexota bacterium]
MDPQTVLQLTEGLRGITWQVVVMMLIGGALIYLAIGKQYEPVLLLPIGLGAIITNIPATGMMEKDGVFLILNEFGINTELFPLIIFIGIGAMTDFGPLLERPYTVLLGAAAQFGIFGTLIIATLLGFKINEAASIGIIGSADGPTSIYVASKLAPNLLAPIAVAAYSYMSLVPVIQPPIMRLLTTKAERRIHMEYSTREISNTTRILFPIVVTVVTGILVPLATPLIGFLMFGNLLRVAGVVERLSHTAQNELVNIVTVFLGFTIGATMIGSKFLEPATILIIAMGVVAFALDTAAGVLFGKIMMWISGRKINPLIGGCGISAFPMSARVVQKVGAEEDFTNHLLFHAMGSNTAGQIASVVAGGIVLALLLK